MRDPAYQHRMAPGDSGAFRSYRHFGSSVGTAAGMTKAEALLHALGELVEHDALSHALASWYLGPPRTAPGLSAAQAPSALYRVDPGSLPPDTAEIHRLVSSRIDGELWLLDITSDVGVPAYFAVACDPAAVVTEVGLGASVLPDYAIQRALAELLQATLVHRQDPQRSRDDRATVFAPGATVAVDGTRRSARPGRPRGAHRGPAGPGPVG